ncbi:fumarate reductase (CoM/CoB) subunit A [Ereboglobus sp. PH5-5]|uniref:FAD-binding protein n=1 Tax=Ereboglobus sp. PH5-5 TaxID=2940529 RepID=UPI002405B508|nr:FAD-binding protein [Ereboglobus sp. PH5-5]MDF9834227.1 fumarate reductase (CoM/CoB) subunit A [Ereboglobus sp. PH5-5]
MTPLQEIQTDVLVIGAGITGLRAGLAARCAGASVLIVAKGAAASPGVIGFNAPVGPDDSVQSFFEDTFKGSIELANPALVRLLTENAAAAAGGMESLGMRLDRTSDGAWHLQKALGCSHPRLLHQENRTARVGMAVLKRALAKGGAITRGGVFVAELLRTREGVVSGALAVDLRERKILFIRAGAVILASGGGGGIYAGGTYPKSLTGDGYALAWRAGAELVDMEFVQFEPCHCIYPKRLGLSTTLFAHGGRLLNAQNKRFVLKQYPTGEGAAPKDALARLVAMEIRAGRGTEHGGVWCDLTDIPKKFITEGHSAYYSLFLKHGIDLTKQRFEVGPAPHTFLGGVVINTRCESTVPGLFAAGEVAGGVHGANRVGGNAGTEIHVFGAIAGASAAAYAKSRGARTLRDAARRAEKLADSFSTESRSGHWNNFAKSIRELMTAKVGVVRDEAALCEALVELKKVGDEAAGVECEKSLGDFVGQIEIQNMAQVGACVAESALRRKESRGVHYRFDYPKRDDAHWKKNIYLRQADGRMRVSSRKKGAGS